MREKRREKRHQISLPVIVERKNRYYHVSKTRNVAASGLQVMMDAELSVGEAVNITYNADEIRSHDYDAVGQVVRIEANEEDDRSEWPFLAAVRFFQPHPQVAAYLAKLEMVMA